MKQSVAIILAAVFIYTVAVHGVLLSLLIQKTKSEVFDKIEKDAFPKSVVAFTFPLKDGQVSDPDFFLEEDREFSYQGKMYDVVKREMQGDKILFYCVQDEKETNLKSLLTGFHGPDKNELPLQNLLHLLKSLTQDYSPVWFNLTSPVIRSSKVFSSLTIFLIEFALPALFQPPEPGGIF